MGTFDRLINIIKAQVNSIDITSNLSKKYFDLNSSSSVKKDNQSFREKNVNTKLVTKYPETKSQNNKSTGQQDFSASFANITENENVKRVLEFGDIINDLLKSDRYISKKEYIKTVSEYASDIDFFDVLKKITN